MINNLNSDKTISSKHWLSTSNFCTEWNIVWVSNIRYSSKVTPSRVNFLTKGTFRPLHLISLFVWTSKFVFKRLDFSWYLHLFDHNNNTCLFDFIKLNQHPNMNPFKSEILTDEQQYFELINLCEFSQMTNGLCCIVPQEMALVQMTFILS